MKKILLSLAIGLFFTSLGFGQGIAGTGHDLPDAGYSITNSEICIVCHTPHNAISTDGPLWNHTANVATGFTMYSSTTLDATIATNPQGESLLCLSCHDGTIAVDAVGGGAGTTLISAGPANFGKDLSGHHPISITYDGALATADDELFDPTSTISGLGGATDYISTDMLFGANNQLECASCHDVHNSSGASYLLIKSNTGSALCLTCHNK